MGGLRKVWLSLSAMALMMGAGGAWAAPAATGSYPASGGELTASETGSAEIEAEDLSGSRAAQRAVFRSGCVFGGTVVTFSGITLPKGRSYLHRVVPDRKGFNVQFQVVYPGLNHKVNRFGPGKAETYSVFALSKVKGKVKVSGVKGSFGCFTLSITP
ncbi:MAG: hypothetical protein AB7I59_15195 [Geminicoccaceae bacterium]